jgi:hypothetical protein
VHSLLKKIFFLDSRSLALFRILLGFFLIADLITRVADLTEFYTDEGVLPRSALVGQFSSPWVISPLNAFGHHSLIFVYMLVALSVYLAFLVGYRTRIATFLSWIFFCSFSARNSVIAHGGDDLVRLCLFWSMFLNLDTKWALHRRPNSPQSLVASMAFISQLLMMYFGTALLKWHPIWHTEGTAIYYALNLDGFTTSMGHWFSQLPLGILKLFSFATLGLELLGPWLWLLCFREWRYRTHIIAIFILFHLGLIFTLELGPFPFACIIYWLALLPAEIWQDLATRFPKYQDGLRPDVTFDDYLKKISIATYLKTVFILICWGIAVAWNVATFSDKDSISLSPYTYRAGNILRLHQKWEMFAPFPKTSDTWLVVNTRLFNETTWDILNDRPTSFEKPNHLADDMVDTLWRKYLINLTTVAFKDHLPHFSRWLCRDWNSSQKNVNHKAIHLEIWMIGERTPPPGAKAQPLEKLKIWDHFCID